MLRKIASLTLASALSAFAINIHGFDDMGASAKKDQRELVTIQDYRQMESDLKKFATKAGPKGDLNLGVFYLSEHKLETKTIPKKYKKGYRHLEKALNAGESMASFIMAKNMIEQNRVPRAMFHLKTGLSQKKEKNLIDDQYSVMAYMFAATTLDANPSKEAAKVAADLLAPAVRKYKKPTPTYMLAHLYNITGKHDLANGLLNIACTDPTAPEKLKQRCFASPNTEVLNKKGNVIETPGSSRTCSGS